MNQIQGTNAFSEKRAKSRITCNFAAIVVGQDEKGREFEENARVVNMSASGIYMLLNRSIGAGEKLSVRIALPTGSLKLGSSKLLTDGNVVRVEPYTTGVMGIAVKFNHYRFR
ncbi:MAG: hypothetical protein CVU46_14070 [Chloroflexi bacterium HGW-Chloroflexi-8]|nr:MAG: hypothetical protein CVU46_14070 [Chloroflexi bacterium HGW-Chloroflexi-8]